MSNEAAILKIANSHLKGLFVILHLTERRRWLPDRDRIIAKMRNPTGEPHAKRDGSHLCLELIPGFRPDRYE